MALARRITGSLVSKGDLVRRKVTQLRFDYELRDMSGYRVDESEEIGIVLSASQPYDRTIDNGDCYVFWSHSRSIIQESSHCLRILSYACRKCDSNL